VKNFLILGCLAYFSCSPVFANKEALHPANGEQPTYCEQIVSLHGLLSRAQLQCGYSQYNQELIDDSRKCFEHELGDKRGTEVLKFGMREFDRNESKQGRKAICADLLKEFSEYVRK
jgi:hypothetical protein